MLKRIELQARRWTDSYGNTYFTAEIYVNDKLFHILPLQYGYGYHYEHVAAQYIWENYMDDKPQLPTEFKRAPSRVARELGIEWMSNVVDVSRKRDLHKQRDIDKLSSTDSE